MRTTMLLAVVALAAQVALAMEDGDLVTDPATYNYQVAIFPVRSKGTFDICSGVLINGTVPYILTSAACAQSGDQLEIYLGTNTLQKDKVKPDMVVDATTAVIHPDFFKSNNEGDLALIPDPGTITAFINNPYRKSVSTISLPDIEDAGKGYLSSTVKMSGWGYNNAVAHSTMRSLRQLTTMVVPNYNCFKQQITNNHFCTYLLVRKTPCTGDAGGPLVLKRKGVEKVIGLATLTPQKGCETHSPSVFTKLAKYLPWINQVISHPQ